MHTWVGGSSGDQGKSVVVILHLQVVGVEVCACGVMHEVGGAGGKCLAVSDAVHVLAKTSARSMGNCLSLTSQPNKTSWKPFDWLALVFLDPSRRNQFA